MRLIRSKGVGVYFVSQNPLDIPDEVLGQLGNRVQHALRAFTPRDQKAVRAAAETFRANPALRCRRRRSPSSGSARRWSRPCRTRACPRVVERTLIRPPCSRIGPATAEERATVDRRSPLAGRYDQAIDRELGLRDAQAQGGRGAAPARRRAQRPAEARRRAAAAPPALDQRRRPLAPDRRRGHGQERRAQHRQPARPPDRARPARLDPQALRNRDRGARRAAAPPQDRVQPVGTEGDGGDDRTVRCAVGGSCGRRLRRGHGGGRRGRSARSRRPSSWSTVASGLDHPWGMAFLPDGGMLITERAARLRLLRDGELESGADRRRAGGRGERSGRPARRRARIPTSRATGWSICPTPGRARTAPRRRVARARLGEGALEDLEVIFRAVPEIRSSKHFGSRLVFDRDGFLYVTAGERGQGDARPGSRPAPG